MYQVFLHTPHLILSYYKDGCIYLAHTEWFLFARHLRYSDEPSMIYSDEMKRSKDSKKLSNLS